MPGFARKWFVNASTLALLTSTFLATVSLAQESSATRAGAPQQPAKVIPTIRTHIYDRLNEAQVCMDEGDLECASDTLDRLENVRDLNNYEVAQLWNFRAFVYFDQDNVDGAIGAYENILDIPYEDMPDGMIQSTMRNLSMLYVQTEQYEPGLETFREWMSLPTVTPTPDDYYFLATIYYSMERYADGIPPLQDAIELANSQGEIGDERWYQLLYVFYFQLEQTDKVIETLSFMVEHWTKRDWLIALAGQLSSQERETDTLALYEAAYEAGLLTRGTEWVQLANMYLNARAPFKAGTLLEKGLNDGTIESTQQNWRLLAQAWQLAAEDERALPAFERASALADDGTVDNQLASSLSRLTRYEECVTVARRALDRGGLDRTDYTYMQLGECLFNLKRYNEAREAFEGAAEDERRSADARRWIRFVDTQAERDRANEEALRSLAQARR